MSGFGEDEGDFCDRPVKIEDGSIEVCDGHMVLCQEPCYCGATPAPCAACENSWLECSVCRFDTRYPNDTWANPDFDWGMSQLKWVESLKLSPSATRATMIWFYEAMKDVYSLNHPRPE